MTAQHPLSRALVGFGPEIRIKYSLINGTGWWPSNGTSNSGFKTCPREKKAGQDSNFFEQGHSQANFLNFFFLKHLF